MVSLGESFMPFLSITDGRIARYDIKNSTIQLDGLYTDNFSSCNIIVLFKATNNVARLSMIHADQTTTTEDVKTEIAWVGHDCQKFVVRRFNNEYSKNRKIEVLGDMINDFAEIACPKEKSGVSVNCAGKIELCDYINFPELIVHPEERKFTSFYKLNLEFNVCHKPSIALNNTKLIFHNDDWQALSTHDKELVPLANTFLKEFRTTSSKNNLDDESLSEVAIHIKNQLKRCNELIMLRTADTPYIIGSYIIQLITNQNHQKMFKAELSSISQSNELTTTEKALTKTLESMSFYEAKKHIFTKFSEELRNKIIYLLGDVYIFCHHAIQVDSIPQKEKSNANNFSI